MRDDRGSVTLFALFLATALLASAGLVIDGGAGIAAASRAADLAENAARAGVIAGGVPDGAGVITMDEPTARAAAVDWLSRQHLNPADSDVSVTPNLVTVVVRIQRPTTLLRLAGVAELHVERKGAARPASGITKEGS
jgi:hypothetical protein